MALLRRVIGDALRARRQGMHRTLRDVSMAANVSLGYLSEIERGQKEASSELLAAICEALGSQLSEVLREASDSLAAAERPDTGLAEAGIAGSPLADGQLTPAGGDAPLTPAEAPQAATAAGAPRTRPVTEQLAPAVPVPQRATRAITDGEVSVSIHRDGPLRTTLHAVRNRRPGRSVAHTG